MPSALIEGDFEGFFLTLLNCSEMLNSDRPSKNWQSSPSGIRTHGPLGDFTFRPNCSTDWPSVTCRFSWLNSPIWTSDVLLGFSVVQKISRELGYPGLNWLFSRGPTKKLSSKKVSQFDTYSNWETCPFLDNFYFFRRIGTREKMLFFWHCGYKNPVGFQSECNKVATDTGWFFE